MGGEELVIPKRGVPVEPVRLREAIVDEGDGNGRPAPRARLRRPASRELRIGLRPMSRGSER